MTAVIASVNVNSDSFGQWITKTNQIAYVITNNAVTTDSNTAVGDAAITGLFAANSFTSSNTGLIALGHGTANVVANNTTVLIRSSSSANALLTSSGLVIDSLTQYSKTAATIGNTVIMGANVTADSIYVRSNFAVGNTIFSPTTVQGQIANLEVINVVYDTTVGNDTANVYTDSTGVNVFYNNGSFTANSRMTATTLWIQNVVANTITTQGDLTFNNSVWFRGANNYFDLGLTAAEDSEFANLTVNGIATFNGNTVFNNNNRILGSIFANGSITANNGLTSNAPVVVNSNVVTREVTFRTPSDVEALKLYSNASSSSYYTLSLPIADGTPTQYLGTDGSGHLNFYTLSGNNTTNFAAKSIGVGAGVNASNNNGEIRAAGNITAYYSSDERLKENVKNIPNALTMIKALNGVEFDWTDEYIEENGGEDGYFIRKHDVGVIAQEVEKVLPEIVGTREDGYKSVKYERLVAVLIEAVKELSAEVDRLKNGN